ncbi:class I adenylate-forming enzyme family protein [Sciscionella marina]|uniref:class I adenylate-forming enzyme family protein n=1 Tax=Sciscionella marina TaxID=508770 RepID=UPI00037E4741|nr:AMP-binding protein [Sciscionella marina]
MTTTRELTARAHRRYASAPAILGAGTAEVRETLSFAELGTAARSCAAKLRAAGLRAGDRVVIAIANRPESLILDHAVFLADLVRVAVGHRLHGKEIAAIAADCAAAAVVCEPGHRAVAEGPWQTIHAGEGLLAEHTDGAGFEPPEPVPPDDAVTALMYTSGSTGSPKGAMVTHTGWAAMVRAFWAELPPVGPGDVVLHVAPMSHFGGSAGSACTFRGAAILPVARFDPAAVLELVERHRVSVLPLVPTMLSELTKEAERTGADLSSLRAIPYGGAPISPRELDRARAVFGERLYQCYGLSEALAPVTVLSGAGHRRAELLGSAGRAHPETEVVVAAPDGEAVPEGTRGEVFIRGPQVTPGYWGAGAATDEHGWLHTGDIGVLDAEGLLYLVDRTSEVILSGGFNVYPSEVERAIEGVPGVEAAVVFGEPHERWGESVAAVVVPHKGGTLTAEEIVRSCRERLAGYKKPLHVEFTESLPLSATGKVARREVRERFRRAQTDPGDDCARGGNP